jgi:hypothetical protein
MLRSAVMQMEEGQGQAAVKVVEAGEAEIVLFKPDPIQKAYADLNEAIKANFDPTRSYELPSFLLSPGQCTL